MILYVYDKNGYFLYSSEFDPKSSVPGLSTDKPVPETSVGEYAVFRSGEWVVITTTPPDEFEVNKDGIKSSLTASVNHKRDVLEEAGFMFMGKELDSTPRSVQRISTAVQAAQLAVQTGTPFTLDWTCKDNSILSMTAQDVLQMPVALAMRANQLHQYARGLKSQIAEANTKEELDGIDIENGWPV